MLMIVLSILLGSAVAVVLGVLLTGVVIFARGGQINHRLGHRLMTLRVAAQAVAIALLGLMVLARSFGWG